MEIFFWITCLMVTTLSANSPDTIKVVDCANNEFILTLDNTDSGQIQKILMSNIMASDSNGFASAIRSQIEAKIATLVNILNQAKSDSALRLLLIKQGIFHACGDWVDLDRVSSSVSENKPVAANGYLDDESSLKTSQSHHRKFNEDGLSSGRMAARMFHTDQARVKVSDILPGKEKEYEIFQGDMIYPKHKLVDRGSRVTGKSATMRGGAAARSLAPSESQPAQDTMYWQPWKLWPNGKVNWYIDSTSTVDSCAIATFRTAASYLEKYTCLRFKEGVSPIPGQTESVKLTSDGSTCWAFVGMDDQSQVNLGGKGCQIPGITLHEIAHAVGLIHQHSRLDRDRFVTIDWQNVQPSSVNNFYKIASGSDYEKIVTNIPYDYTSIMHYGECEFSTDTARTGNCARTIDPADESIAPAMGQRDHLSPSDIDTINSMYGCTATCGDGIQNQGEEGIDCGGPCNAVCSSSNDGIVPLPSECQYESSRPLSNSELIIIACSAAGVVMLIVITIIIVHNRREKRKELAKANLITKSKMNPEQLREVLRRRKDAAASARQPTGNTQ
jgi:hypothetical protein